MQQRFRSKKYNLFNEEVGKIVFSANDDKTKHSIDSIKTNVYGTNEETLRKTRRN